MTSTPEFIELALGYTQAEFILRCPFFFLVGDPVLVRPDAPRNTGAFPAIDDHTNPGDWSADYTAVPEPEAPKAGDPLVLPVRKVQENFPSMITVGRTRNNDIVLNDVSVSKFHAYFKIVENRVELADAGSLVGTWVGDKRLPSKGTACVVISGELVRFAYHELQFLDAGTFWSRMRGPDGRAPA